MTRLILALYICSAKVTRTTKQETKEQKVNKVRILGEIIKRIRGQGKLNNSGEKEKGKMGKRGRKWRENG